LSAQKAAAQKWKQTGETHPPIGNYQEEDSLTSDTGNDRTSRMATIERLQQLVIFCNGLYCLVSNDCCGTMSPNVTLERKEVIKNVS
jgi:hypothetical protein